MEASANQSKCYSEKVKWFWFLIFDTSVVIYFICLVKAVQVQRATHVSTATLFPVWSTQKRKWNAEIENRATEGQRCHK